MEELRIFSYLPNPRIWKATIAARLNGVNVAIRGGKPNELSDWLWDFDARPLTAEEKVNPPVPPRSSRTGFKTSLVKTDEFMQSQPFGTVPAAFAGDTKMGVFESNSIMRAVARLGEAKCQLYGADAIEASRIDSFLDVSLVFARSSQIYLLSLVNDELDAAIHEQAQKAFSTYLGGIEQALSEGQEFLVGAQLSIADICYVCELCLFSRELSHGPGLGRRGLDPIFVNAAMAQRYPNAIAHFERLCAHPAVEPDVGPFRTRLAEASAA